MQHLYFVRHGLSDMNQSGVFSGRSETPLNETGRNQSIEAGEALKHARIDCIVCSPMARTRQTAEIIADQIGFPKDKIIYSALFAERDFGPLEGEPYKPNLGDHAGVEKIDDLIERAGQGCKFLEALPADNVLVVSHGAIGRALRHHVSPDIPFRPSKGFENAQVVQFF